MSNYWADDQRRFMILGEQTIGKFNEEQAWRYADHMEEEAQETGEALTAKDYVKAIDGAVDTIVVAIGLLHSLGVDPFKAWDAVHKANMRKVSGECGPIVRRDDGQLGKPIHWYGPEEDLAKLWNGVEA